MSNNKGNKKSISFNYHNSKTIPNNIEQIKMRREQILIAIIHNYIKSNLNITGLNLQPDRDSRKASLQAAEQVSI